MNISELAIKSDNTLGPKGTLPSVEWNIIAQSLKAFMIRWGGTARLNMKINMEPAHLH